MSRFYSLAIEGEGTAQVEAFASYVYRLAELHSTTTGGFMTALAQRNGHFLARNVLAASAVALIRPNATTATVVGALADALGRDASALEPMTFLALCNALNRSMNTFAARSRWCAACLAEQKREGRPPHYLLLWQLTALSACHLHPVRLRDRCPSCNKHQDSYRQRSSLARCVFCDHSLDKVSRSDLELRGNEADLVDLVREISQRPGLRFPAGGVARVIEGVFDEVWRRGLEDRLYRRAQLDDCIRFSDASEPITLGSARRLAQVLQIPIATLLSGDLSGTTRPLFEPEDETPRPQAGTGKRTKVGAGLRGRLSTLMRSHSRAAPSLRGVSEALGISTGALRYWCPEQSRQIVACHARALEKQMRRKKEACSREVARVLRSWDSGEGVPARKRVLACLRAKTGLPKNLLRGEIAKHVPWDGYEEARP